MINECLDEYTRVNSDNFKSLFEEIDSKLTCTKIILIVCLLYSLFVYGSCAIIWERD